jgi:capsular exopolysaccharide synthesis family protein
LITSASRQEGKTYNVVNLSLTLAQSGEKVLLIDADLRRPFVHQIFGLERQPGLTDYIMGTGGAEPKPENTVEFDMNLTFNSGQTDNGWKNVASTIMDVMLGEFELDDILKTPGMDNLHIIKAGQGLLNPSEILRSSRFKEFLSEAREHYDIIIIDTPPVLPVADAFEVAPEVDGVILVYQVGRIGRGILHRAKVQLEKVNSTVFGVILNNVKPDVAPDFYNYGTDCYYRDEYSDQESAPPSRWREFVGQPLRISQNIMRSTPRETRGKRIVGLLFLIVGILAIVGLASQSFPTIKSAFQRRPDQMDFRAQQRFHKKPIIPATSPKRTELVSSDLSPARESLKTASIETAPHGQLLEQKEIRPGQPVISQPRGKEAIEPAGQAAEEQPTVQKEVVVPTSVTEEQAIAEKEPAYQQKRIASPGYSIQVGAFANLDNADRLSKALQRRGLDAYYFVHETGLYKVRFGDFPTKKAARKKAETVRAAGIIKAYYLVSSNEYAVTKQKKLVGRSYLVNEILENEKRSIRGFVENWRRAWEEGDLQTYTGCYHTDFKTEKMTTQEWKMFKREFFSSSAIRRVQINDMKIEANGDNAVVTFKQSYQTASHRSLGIKTLYLRHDDYRWTIIREDWQPFFGQG